nr:hypothetical protein [Streptomyces shenzhenensis]
MAVDDCGTADGNLVEAGAQLVDGDVQGAGDASRLVLGTGADVDAHGPVAYRPVEFVPLDDGGRSAGLVVGDASEHVDGVTAPP